MNLTQLEKLTILGLFIEKLGEDTSAFITDENAVKLNRIMDDSYGNTTMNEAKELVPRLIDKLVKDVIELDVECVSDDLPMERPSIVMGG